MNNNMLFSTAYLAPVEYYVHLLHASEIYIEKFENYTKQTYRNRCYIYNNNGRLGLSIPVIKVTGNHTLIKDIRISYHTNWQRIHWRAITSAYNSSPFFLYYEDDFYPFFSNKYDFLLDFNQQLLETTLKLIGVEKRISFTSEYYKEYANTTDLRDAIHPQQNNLSKFPHYTQVFDDKFGFIPNLSIIDLLFNEGSNTYDYLSGKNPE